MDQLSLQEVKWLAQNHPPFVVVELGTLTSNWLHLIFFFFGIFWEILHYLTSSNQFKKILNDI